MRPSPILFRVTIKQRYNLVPSIPKPSITPIACQCSYPESHPINYDKPLLNTKSPTYKHVLIPTTIPATEWPSKVELIPGSLLSEFSSSKKTALDPMYPIMISNIQIDDPKGDVLIFPDNKWHKITQNIPEFMTQNLTPTNTPDQGLSNENQYIFICGHAQRDIRCGLIAPILKKEFEHVLGHHGLLYNKETNPGGIKVGIVSHIGGHAYAGNVVYFDKEGLGVWYGRVEVDHVDPIVKHTILGNEIFKDLFRGRYQ
ncbi:hypothetical protein BN7_5747 [Wickerhamomyces ciferrii]|uniref:Altered inheritance of mitochondria protein 32 n=1 Tax=Wickerhamomyces ciferrii (strain ATCC 14091 / BCRC 22168 / CBS 111 / JCM 3599 / NBRC 0793 / NRRL Y-1031 F-60-10) TaxID=1206466 RepID=K0KXF4_WICCF|nr:uncharacterized protein BN7_5747 [Wickerhamomyces ciferrii]CCH46159.1 hypothetical protein BN7_5747 [Wickerhamomyces ciferrii]